mgnify:CR=1 FL=1
MSEYTISNTVRNEAIAFMEDDRKVDAIKAVRIATRSNDPDGEVAGLKMCKEYVEAGCPTRFMGGGDYITVLSTREELTRRMASLTVELVDAGIALRLLDEEEEYEDKDI